MFGMFGILEIVIAILVIVGAIVVSRFIWREAVAIDSSPSGGGKGCFVQLLYSITFFGCLIGGYMLLSTVLFPGQNAVQQASSAAVAIGFAVIPYCLARAIDGMSSYDGELLSVMRRTNELMEMAIRMDHDLPPPKQPPVKSTTKPPSRFSLTE